MTSHLTHELVERDAELDALRAGLRDRSGTALLVIEGPPGIGKTRLLAAVAAAARAGGARVLHARASELERELPFGVARQLLEPVLAAAPPAEREELLAGAAALALPALEAEPEEPAAGSFAVLHGLYWLSANVAASTPLVLCVDDLHWADHPSLRALAYLLARLDGVDAQLCVALRPHEPGTDAALIAAVTDAAAGRFVRPAPFSADATAEFVGARLGEAPDAAFSAACRIASGGNPLLLSELVRALADARVVPSAGEAHRVHDIVPDGVGAGVLRRLDRLAPEAPAVAQALAILGDGGRAADVAALAGVGEPAASAVLDALTRTEILESARPPAFAHPLVRAAIAADVPPAQRGRLHDQAARLLAERGVGAPRLAAHLLEAPPAGDPWVVETLRAAAGEALARGAPEPAAALLRRALEEPPAAEERTAVLIAAGGAEAQAGDPRGLAHLLEAVATAADAPARAHAAIAAAPVLGIAGQLETGVELVRTALDGLDGDADLRLRLEAELANLARLGIATRPLALEILDRLQRSELGDGAAACVIYANLATESLARGESTAEALELAERALAGGRLMTAPFMYALAANAIMIAGRYAHALAAWDDFILHARARGDIPSVAFAHAFRAGTYWRAGNTAEAIADVDVALDAGPAHGFGLAAGFATAFLVEVRLLRGELAEARAALAPVAVGAAQLQDTLLLSARGRLRRAEGRPREALEDFAAVGRLLEEWAVPNVAMAPWRADAALAHHVLGETEAARRLAAADVKGVRRWGDPWLLGQALRAQALVGPDGERRALLEEAVGVLRPSEARLELARTLAELGAVQRDAEARETLREALDLATRCHAPGLAAHVREALIDAGGRPRRAVRTGPEALTPTEARVARLAADGPTNREIAQSLFVTEKTVETHLAGAYRKLGIRGRGQLAAALAEA